MSDDDDIQRIKVLQQKMRDRLAADNINDMRQRYINMGHPDDGGAYMLKGKLDG